jgi:hypothetical protein
MGRLRKKLAARLAEAAAFYERCATEYRETPRSDDSLSDGPVPLTPEERARRAERKAEAVRKALGGVGHQALEDILLDLVDEALERGAECASAETAARSFDPRMAALGAEFAALVEEARRADRVRIEIDPGKRPGLDMVRVELRNDYPYEPEELAWASGTTVGALADAREQVARWLAGDGDEADVVGARARAATDAEGPPAPDGEEPAL